jgi:hypothetical protein
LRAQRAFFNTLLGKEIRVIDIAGSQITQRVISIPVFRPLVRLTTTAATLTADLARQEGAPGAALVPWVELTVTDGRSHPDLDRQVREAATGLRLRVLKVLTPAPQANGDAAGEAAPPPSLVDLRPEDVFAERLRRERIDPVSEEGNGLVHTFSELLSGMHEADVPANEEAET